MLKILLAHDDEVMRGRLRDALAGHRGTHIVAVAEDGRKAADEAIALDPDVVVTSVSIPVLNGIEVARALVEKKPAIATVLLSKDDPASAIPQAFRAGARGYLFEASIPSELANAVRTVASGQRYLGPGVVDKMFDWFQASRSDVDALGRLNAVERQILRLVADGKSNIEVAAVLGLSPRTVETYRAGLTHRLGLEDVPSLVKFAIRLGIIPLD